MYDYKINTHYTANLSLLVGMHIFKLIMAIIHKHFGLGLGVKTR